VTDPNGNNWNYYLNGVGWADSVKDPANGMDRYKYDRDGQLRRPLGRAGGRRARLIRSGQERRNPIVSRTPLRSP